MEGCCGRLVDAGVGREAGVQQPGPAITCGNTWRVVHEGVQVREACVCLCVRGVAVRVVVVVVRQVFYGCVGFY